MAISSRTACFSGVPRIVGDMPSLFGSAAKTPIPVPMWVTAMGLVRITPRGITKPPKFQRSPMAAVSQLIQGCWRESPARYFHEERGVFTNDWNDVKMKITNKDKFVKKRLKYGMSVKEAWK